MTAGGAAAEGGAPGLFLEGLWLGQFKAGVAGDGVAEFLAQRAFLLIVGQLEQVETRRRRR